MKTNDSQLLDKKLIADSFLASAATYDEHATVQKEISRQLIDCLKAQDQIDYSRVLEIGCCTGILTNLLVESHRIETLYLNDLVPEFCSATGKRVARRVARVEGMPGDVEKCALPGELGLVISSATFQWMADLPTLFNKIHRALCPDGCLAFSIFGPGTMGEISELTGRSLAYHSQDALRQMLQDRFRLTLLQDDRRRLYFPSVRAVLQHIRQTGVGGLGRSKWLPGRFKEFDREYRARFAGEGGLPVTYASTFVVAKKKG